MPEFISLYILDFDGVLCDSVLECFVSSWYAYYGFHLGTLPSSTEIKRKASFYRFRPFIRTGEDYMLIQSMIDRGVVISNQEEFDAEKKTAGKELMARYRDEFYRARGELLESQRSWWLAMNRLYPGLQDILLRLRHVESVHILSTKKPEFIVEILKENGIMWPRDRIHDAEKRRKLPFISELMSANGAKRAVFVDDQLDHLSEEGYPEIERLLAAWGYVQSSWLMDGAVRVITLDGFIDLLSTITS